MSKIAKEISVKLLKPSERSRSLARTARILPITDGKISLEYCCYSKTGLVFLILDYKRETYNTL